MPRLKPSAGGRWQLILNVPSLIKNLAVILAYLSNFDQVVSESDKALQSMADDAKVWEQRLYSFSYHPDLSAEQIYAEFVRWGDRFPEPVVDFRGTTERRDCGG